MTSLAFVSVCLAGAVLAMLARPWRRIGQAVGLAGLAVAFVAALLVGSNVVGAGQVLGPFGPFGPIGQIGPFAAGEGVAFGGVDLVPGSFAGLFLAAGIGVCLLLAVLDLAAGPADAPSGDEPAPGERSVHRISPGEPAAGPASTAPLPPGGPSSGGRSSGGRSSGPLAPAALATFGGLGLAFAATDPAIALLCAAAAAMPALVIVATARGDAAAAIARNELRTAVLVATAGLLAAALALGPVWASGDSRPALAVAYLLVALAVGVRSGAVPFHAPAARVSMATGRLGLPLVLAWIPAGLALVATSWVAKSDALGGEWLAPASVAIVAAGVGTLVLGAVGALLHDELGEIAAYSIVQDAGFALLALGLRGDAGADSLRLWLVTFAIAKSALVAWSVAIERAFGTGDLRELDGWARRAPLLGAALVAVVAATIGWPGSPISEARASLINLTLPGPLELVGPLAILLSLACYVRLFAVGLLGPSEIVRAGRGERLRIAAARQRPAAAAGFDAAAIPGRARSPRGDGAATTVIVRTRLVDAAAALARATARLIASARLNASAASSAVVLGIAVMALAIALGYVGGAATQSGLALDNAAASAAVPAGDVPLPSGADARATLPPGYIGP